MSSALESAGAVKDPSRAAPLTMSRLFTGIWTNRSPLRDAATPYLYEKFYSASRQDSIIDGLNTEITSKLTLRRRPGSSIYNTQTFPAIDRFYEFRKFSATSESIQVIADCAATVYDATGPNTKAALFTKSAGAGRSSFQSVGNVMYFGNGVDQKKYVQSILSWTPNTAFTAGQFIVDPNGNIQVVAASIVEDIAVIQVNSSNVVSFGLKQATIFSVGMQITPINLTSIPALNGVTLTITFVSGQTVRAVFTNPAVATVAETGSIETLPPGSSAAVQPTWNMTQSGLTIDGGVTWINKGPAVMNWMFPGPVAAPTIAVAQLPNAYLPWKASTLYSSSLQIVDTNGNIQQLTQDGITGSSQPSWNVTTGGMTTDGTAAWTNKGTATRFPATMYAVNVSISVTFTYYVTIRVPTGGQAQQGGTTTERIPVTATNTFICGTAGTTGTATPNWSVGSGSKVNDGSVVWINTGVTVTWPNIGANKSVAIEQTILDTNGNLQLITQSGTSGTSQPVWSTVTGSTTVDGTCLWTNQGPYSAAGTAPWLYSYSYGNSITGDESSRSPLSLPLTLPTDSLVNIQGVGSPDSQVDTIFIYRTLQGGSSQLRMTSLPAPTAGQIWTYQDTNPDNELNPLIQATTNNYPPPAGASALCYHLGRIWVAVNNVVFYSATPGATVGVSVSAFPPLNSFTFPSQVIRLYPTTIGLIVGTISDLYIITGDGATTLLTSQLFVGNLGIRSYDALGINGTTLYILSADSQLLSLDVSAGITEAGFPIADVFEATQASAQLAGDPYFDPAAAYLTFHAQGSSDKALYVADGATGWYRLTAVTAPESGFAWSPKALITGGVQAVKSVEVMPGVHSLLLGPVSSGPILQRDLTKNTDNTAAYTAYTTFGNIVLAQPGQVAGLWFITLDSIAVGTKASVGLLLGEISGTFEYLKRTRQDPPTLPPAKTLYNDRYSVSQNPQPIWCRHFQLQIQWVAEDAANELLSFTVFGELRNESVSQ